MTTPKSRELEIAKLLIRYTDADHGITLKEIQGDTAEAADGTRLNRYLEGNLAEVGCASERKSVSLAIAQLQEAGLPIEKVRNGNRHEYRLVRHAFTDHELDLVFAAIQSSNALTERTAAEIQQHLLSLASDEQRARLKTHKLVSGHVRRQADSAFEKLDPIYDAIATKRQLHFKYYEYDVNKKRVPRTRCDHDVTPVHVAYSEGFYYLLAYSSGSNGAGMRTYRIDHMDAICARDAKAASNDEIREIKRDPQAYLKRMFNMFGGESVRVTLLVEEHLMRAIIDRFGADMQAFPAHDGAAHVYASVNLSPTFYSWVLQFDGGVKVTAPKAARTGLREFLTRNVALYD